MFRRRIAMVASAAAALAVIILPSGTANAAQGQITGLAGKCVDVAGANNANGTAVQLYDCNGTGAQQWNNTGSALQALGKCLDVAGGGTANGTVVQLWDCNGTGAQNWVVSGANDIVNIQANKCLDVTGNNSANGTRLQIWECTGGPNQKWNAPPSGGNPPPSGNFVVSEAQFNQMFPGRNGFYTYSGLIAALNAYPAFAKTGSDVTRKQEAAAFLANVSHETGGLVHVVEQNQANYPHYCDWGQPYGCPAGQAAYYGRGPIQLSWNFNYKAAGDALGLPLLTNPWLVQNDASVAWRTGIWYWMTQNGPGTMTPHNAMVNGAGFGETIRSINGSLECNGRNPAQVQSRVNNYNRFVGILGVPAGNNLYC
ncbi:chitinase [Kibdelosporangium aridum]|uniref:Chitinase n=1 Tax=Kibdelosporangium aridum TaxID=2030 RepID=A0A428Z494_KIBAR|nr:chitinase [Kibdelosporangium aridum]RSM81244.1 chitinase [Kibdelosporangium aridum]